MSKIYLITDITSSFALKMAKGLLDRDNIVIGLNSSFENKLFNEGKKNKNFHIINWNPASPLSANKVIKESINKLTEIDHILLVFSPTGEEKSFETMSKLSVEAAIDNKIKGTFYILNEIIQLFLKSNKGSISIINDKTSKQLANPIDYVINSMAKSVAKSLIEEYSDKNFFVEYMDSQNMIDSEFSSFILKLLSDNTRENNKFYEEKEDKKRSSFFKF